MTYTQCKLNRKTSNGFTTKTAWIPSLFAKENMYLRIGDVNGWQVVGVGGTLSADYVNSHSRDYARAFPSLR